MELKTIGIRKWLADFSGVAPTLDSTSDVNIGDIALDTSQTPYTYWECVDNTATKPVWRKLSGRVDRITNIIASYLVSLADELILADTSALAANLVLTLPDATLCNGQSFSIKMVNGTFGVDITPMGGQTIETLPLYTLALVFDYVKITSEGANWIIT